MNRPKTSLAQLRAKIGDMALSLGMELSAEEQRDVEQSNKRVYLPVKPGETKGQFAARVLKKFRDEGLLPPKLQ